MGYVRARIEELLKAGLKVNQAVVEKYLIHPGEEWHEAQEKVGSIGGHRRKKEEGKAITADIKRNRGEDYEER